MSDKTKKLFADQLKDELIICFVKGLGLLIGKPCVKDQVVPSVKTPRLLELRIDDKRLVHIVISELVGNPEEFFLVEDPSFTYKVKDKKVRGYYVKKTTNIELADKMPSVLPNNLRTQ